MVFCAFASRGLTMLPRSQGRAGVGAGWISSLYPIPIPTICLSLDTGTATPSILRSRFPERCSTT